MVKGENFMVKGENFEVVLGFLKEAVNDLTGGKLIAPSKKNALELLIVSDIVEMVKGCKENGSFSMKEIEKTLENKYSKCLQGGRASTFYNYREVLKSPIFLAHFKRRLSQL